MKFELFELYYWIELCELYLKQHKVHKVKNADNCVYANILKCTALTVSIDRGRKCAENCKKNDTINLFFNRNQHIANFKP